MSESVERPYLGKAVPCAVCGMELQGQEHSENQAVEGLYFRSFGAYGTTVFDPMDGHFIEINVCDECLRYIIEEGSVLQGKAYQLVIDYDNEPLPLVTGTEPVKGVPLRRYTGEGNPTVEFGDVEGLEHVDEKG